VLVYSKERVAGIKEIKNLHDFGKRLQNELLICTQSLG
jgi:hypothetical protein